MSLTVAPLDAGRAEWLAWRRSGVGASDAAGVLGISPWGSPWAVWADKVGLFGLDDDDTGFGSDDSREFGRRAEAMIVPWFEDTTGLHIPATQLWARNDLLPWILATPDGAVTDRSYCTGGGDCPFPSHPKALHEGASSRLRTEDLQVLAGMASQFDGLEAKTEFDGKAWAEIPVWYQSQGQWQMAATGWETVWFAVLHGRRFRTYVLRRDQGDIDEMVDRIGEWWETHVTGRVAPPIDGSDATLDLLTRLYPAADLSSSVALDHIAGSIRDYVDAKADEATATARAKQAAAEIRDAMGGAYEGTVAGARALTLGSQTKRTICRHCGTVDESDPFRVLRITKTKTVKGSPR